MEPSRGRNWCIMTRIIFLALLCQNNYFWNNVEGRRFHHKKIKHKSVKSHVAPSPSPSVPSEPVIVIHDPPSPPPPNITNSNNDNNCSISSPSSSVPSIPIIVTHNPPSNSNNNDDNNSSVSSPSAHFTPVVVTYSPAPPPYSNNNDNNSSVSSPSAPFAPVVVTYGPAPPPHSNNNDNNSSVSSPSAPFAPVVVTYGPAPPPHSNNNDNNSSVSSPSTPFAPVVVTYNPAPPPYNSNNDNSNNSISSPIPSIPSDPIVIHDPPPPTNNNNYIDNNSSISSPSPSVPTGPVVVTYNPPPPYNKQNDKNNSSISSPSPSVPSDPVIVIHDPPPSNSNDDNRSNANCIFNVLSFGAIGDGCSNDTAAFRQAWKAACAVEYATVLVPSDYTFLITSTIFSGPCKPGLVFQVDGVIMPPDGPESWPKSDSPKQWIIFYRLDQMTFTGNGTIQGNGEKWWELPCKPHRGPNNSTLPGPCDSPALIQFFTSSNLTVSGLRIINSPKFHMKFKECEGVLIEKLSISSPKLSPNTDGIHFDNTNNVGIYNSIISNGDDCISIGTGCSNIEIEDVTCRLGHGISIGSLGQLNSHAYVSNISVQNIMIKDSDNGLRIKTWQGGTGCVKQISFENIQMENVRNCIIVDQYYCLSKGCRNQTSAVFLTEVSYKNVRGTYDVRSPPIHFACSDTVPCTNITMSEVELFPYAGELIDDPFCWNTYGTQETLTIPPIDCFLDGQPQEIGEVSSCGCSR